MNKLTRQIELICRSSERMRGIHDLVPERGAFFWAFLKRESWIHLKRSLGLWWMVIRGKE